MTNDPTSKDQAVQAALRALGIAPRAAHLLALGALYDAGRQGLHDDQERIAQQILGELEAEEDPAEGTAGWLHDFLSGIPRDRKVILQKDAEGNGYSPLSDAGEGMYLAETTWSGEMYATPEDIAADAAFTEADSAPDGAERVVILWPVN